MKQSKILADIKKGLKKKYNEVPEEWEMQLDQLATHLDIYAKAKANLEEQSVTVTNRFGEQIPNPNLKIMNDASVQLTKLAEKFGLNPYSMKRLAVEADENEDFLSNLIND